MNGHEYFEHYLLHLAESIDISDAQKEAVVGRYKAVTNWLGDQPSPLNQFDPEVYPQGSFALGTVVRPLSGNGEFDLDIVIELNLTESNVNQAGLKQMVGDRLKTNETYRLMLAEKNRCWQLQYSDTTHFHMDILPGIPELPQRNLAEQRRMEFGLNSILIPDKQLKEWRYTNPKDYLIWFKSKMKKILAEQRAILAAKLKVDVSEIPDYKVLTPLQRSIQILKRHRDVMFGEDDSKPISIIITTLAADHYKGQRDITTAIESLISGMKNDIRIETGDIKNPVDSRENFAEKWGKHPERQVAFKDWLTHAERDIHAIRQSSRRELLVELAGNKFGQRTALEAANLTTTIFGSATASIHTTEQRPPSVIVKEARPWHH